MSEGKPIKVIKGYNNVKLLGDRRVFINWPVGSGKGYALAKELIKGTAIYRPRADVWEVWPDEQNRKEVR